MTPPSVYTIQADKKRLLKRLLLGAVFVVLGMTLFHEKQSLDWLYWLAGAMVLFSGFGCLPGSIRLELTPEGVGYYHTYRREFFYRWSDMGPVLPIQDKAVGFNLLNGIKPRGLPLAKKMIGVDVFLQPEIFDMAPAELAALLNSWREQHTPKS